MSQYQVPENGLLAARNAVKDMLSAAIMRPMTREMCADAIMTELPKDQWLAYADQQHQSHPARYDKGVMGYWNDVRNVLRTHLLNQ